jgi:hypothetical protein
MRYMEHTVGFNADAAADRGLELVGTWYTMGSTGRWPQVVNLGSAWTMVGVAPSHGVHESPPHDEPRTQ